MSIPDRRSLLSLLVASLAVVLLSGCQFFLPRALPSAYVVNIDGSLIVRDMCSQSLGEVEATWSRLASGESVAGAWRAVATQPAVAEFALFADSQPGVMLIDGEAPTSPPAALDIVLVDSRGFEGRLIIPQLDEFEPGFVLWANSTEVAPIDVADFERMHREFGC